MRKIIEKISTAMARIAATNPLPIKDWARCAWLFLPHPRQAWLTAPRSDRALAVGRLFPSAQKEYVPCDRSLYCCVPHRPESDVAWR
jgi:hypothetical protein